MNQKEHETIRCSKTQEAPASDITIKHSFSSPFDHIAYSCIPTYPCIAFPDRTDLPNPLVNAEADRSSPIRTVEVIMGTS